MNQKSPRLPWSFRDLGGLLFPQRCPVCDKALPFGPRHKAPLETAPDPFFHPACLQKLHRAEPPAPGEPLALLDYDETARFSIARFKYHGRQDFAAGYGRLWAKELGPTLLALKPEALIPVPIHRSRLVSRGYNQASLLAWELEKWLKIPCREDIIIRAKHTGAQKALGRRERLSNMENAFRPVKKAEGIHCALIVDDIYTTGSTAHSLERALKEAGVERVFVTTLARAGH